MGQKKTDDIRPRASYYLPKGTELDGKLISNLIKRHSADIKVYDFLASYLDGQEPYMVRQAPNPILAINNFAGYIVNLNSAYLVGNPVQYQASQGINIDPILDNYKDQNIYDLDSELAEDCSTYGRAYELVYADEDATPLSAKLNVRSTILIRDDSFKHEVMYAIVATPVLSDSGEPKADAFHITVWDDRTIRRFTLNGETLTEEEAEEEHFFGRVPVIEYVNNRRCRGDYESVISLIDAYNILQSDRIIDREKLVDAILAFYGVNMTDEDRQKLKEGRVITLPQDAKGEYIIKNINETDADVLRETLAKDIHKFSMTPDMTDEQFSGNSSGVAISYKLLPFEENCKTKERYFERSLMERFKLYNQFLATKSQMQIVPISDIDAIFTRSLPKNDLEISQIINNLQGMVDTPQLIAQLSFIKDGEEAFELAKKEEESEPTNYATTPFSENGGEI